MFGYRLQTLRLIAVFCSGLPLLGQPAATNAEDLETYRSTLEQWHRDRADRLTAEDGWLALIGLFWLEEGTNSLGSESGNDIALPAAKAPPHVGTLTLSREQVSFDGIDGVAVTLEGEPVTSLELAVDTSGSPTVLDLGDLQFYVIERSGRFGLRVRDRKHPARFDFSGIEIFPIDPVWRITGQLESHDPPRSLPVPNVLGQVNELASPGTVIFELAGGSHRLSALPGPDGALYLIFTDRTSGRETYGGGRFLYTDAVEEDGSVVLDFNKAHNPPCAFTDYATCPLPPRVNKLQVRIEAGEKSFDQH